MKASDLFIKALEKMKLPKLHAIVGGSIGGCLIWEMIALKNDLASLIIPVAADWKANDWLLANTFLQDRILKNSRDPVSDARIHAMTFYRTPKSLKDNKEELEYFKNIDADLAIVVAYGQIIPKEFLSLAFINLNVGISFLYGSKVNTAITPSGFRYFLATR